MAPTTDVIRLPIMLEVWIPNALNIQPPNTPPATQTMRLTSQPKPPPRISFPAISPEISQININQIKLIIISILIQIP